MVGWRWNVVGLERGGAGRGRGFEGELSLIGGRAVRCGRVGEGGRHSARRKVGGGV